MARSSPHDWRVLLGAMTSSSPRQALRHFRRDVKDMVVDFVDSRHFGLEAHVDCCAEQIDLVFVCESPQGVRPVGCMMVMSPVAL